MIKAYIDAAMEHATYKMIEDEEPFFGEIPPCEGVWAIGKTLEACRKELESVLEGWLIISLKKNLPIPEIDGISLDAAEEANVT